MSRARAGNGFRDELQQSLRLHLGCWTHCFDHTGTFGPGTPKRPADLVATWRGHSLLLEAKETRVARLPFSRVEGHQARALERQNAAGGLALVAVKWIDGNRSRAWVVGWPEWRVLQAFLRRASIPLRDGERPAALLELRRVELDPTRVDRVWDLRPVLEALAREVAA